MLDAGVHLHRFAEFKELNISFFLLGSPGMCVFLNMVLACTTVLIRKPAD